MIIYLENKEGWLRPCEIDYIYFYPECVSVHFKETTDDSEDTGCTRICRSYDPRINERVLYSDGKDKKIASIQTVAIEYINSFNDEQ